MKRTKSYLGETYGASKDTEHRVKRMEGRFNLQNGENEGQVDVKKKKSDFKRYAVFAEYD